VANYPNYVAYGTADAGENDFRLYVEASGTMAVNEADLASHLKIVVNGITGESNATVTKNAVTQTSL
jgi:hypothetical protein